MKESIRKNPSVAILVLLFVALSVWWFINEPFKHDESLQQAKYIWGAAYQLVAIFGAIYGFRVASEWGGLKSVFGKAITLFSLGLLLQAFGQSVYSFYNLFLQVEAPYPSLGDLGFFGSIPCYILGTIFLSKVSGAHLSLKSYGNKIQAILIPVLLLIFSYVEFLKQYEFDWTSPLRVLLDFGYPMGQAIYVSLAILAFILSRKTLGGIMRIPVFLILIALIAQYFADFNFLYQFSNESWYVGGTGDYWYLLAYFVMGLSLVNLGAVMNKARG